MLQNSSTDAHVTNPCYPRGYRVTIPTGQVFSSLCTAQQRPASYDHLHDVTFEGTGNPWLCREKVASVFDFRACRGQEDCSFDGVYQPKVQGPFVVRTAPRGPEGGQRTPGPCPSGPGSPRSSHLDASVSPA